MSPANAAIWHRYLARLPKVGDLRIVLRSDATAVAIIELVAVTHTAFRFVDTAFAAREGEGDGTLRYWRDAHRNYFQRVCARFGGQFSDDTVVICQSFDLLWNGNQGDSDL
jgi:uncharacterized protein YhfF